MAFLERLLEWFKRAIALWGELKDIKQDATEPEEATDDSNSDGDANDTKD